MRPLVDLNTNTFGFDGKSIRLEPKEAELLHTICAAYPRCASHDQIILGMWGRNGGPYCADEMLRVLISRLRPRLADIGLAIETERNVGYKLRLRAVATMELTLSVHRDGKVIATFDAGGRPTLYTLREPEAKKEVEITLRRALAAIEENRNG